jgi:DNA polymerase-4
MDIPSPSHAPLRWLFLDLNSYFASVEQQLEPRLRGRPVVVAPAESEYTCAIAASVEAKRFGIKTGTMIKEARGKCPGLVVVNARHDVYVKTHHRIVREIWRHIPVTTVCSIDEVACRLIGRERDPAYATDLARRIKQGIRANVGECLTSSVGLAPTRLLAKLASDMQKPDGLTVLEGRDLPDKILPLKLTDLTGIGRNMLRRLQERGVCDMAALWNLQPKQARALWGSVEGERIWYALHGFDLPERETVRRSVGHSHVLAAVMRTLSASRLVARRLLLKAATRLRRMDYAAGMLILHMRFEGGAENTLWGARRVWESETGWAADARFHPTQDTVTLLAELEKLWAGLVRNHRGRRPRAVGVVLCDLRPAGSVAPDLFVVAAATREKPRGLDLFKAIDRLNKKYGQDTVALGVLPGQIAKYVGAKIAFTRIPELAEFDE